MKKLALVPFLIIALVSSSGCGLIKRQEEEDKGLTAAGLANNTFEAGNEVGVKNLALGLDLAQSFTSTTLATLNFVELTMLKVNSPGAATITVTIEGDANDAPNNVPMGGASAIRTVADLSATHAVVRFNFSGTVQLAANVKYWLRVTISSGPQPSTGALVKWAGSQNNPYPRGGAKYQLATFAWTDVLQAGTGFSGPNHDFVFRLGRQ